MPIEFRCTQCGRLLRVPDNTAGRPAQCPGCGALMTIPGGAAAHGETHGPTHGAGAQSGGSVAGQSSASPGGGAASHAPGQEKGTVPFSLRRKLGQSPAIGQSPGDSDNPYQSPQHYGETMPLGRMGQAGTPAGRVVAPAIGLIAVAVLQIEMLVLIAVGAVAGMAWGPRGLRGIAADVPAAAAAGIVLAVVALGIVLSVLVIVGAMKMKNLESRPLAITAAVVVMLPVFFPGFLVGLPFGIWALVVLNDPQVKPLFETGQRYVY